MVPGARRIRLEHEVRTGDEKRPLVGERFGRAWTTAGPASATAIALSM